LTGRSNHRAARYDVFVSEAPQENEKMANNSDENGRGLNPRLDRIEGILETVVKVQADMQQEHQMLLRAQVIQGDEMRQLSKKTDERFQSLAVAQERLTAAQERMDDALTGLMGTVDLLIQRPTNPPA